MDLIDSPANLEEPASRPAAGLPEPALASRAVGEVLRPLARLMIDHGLQLPSAVELLKEALVAEASESFGLSDKGSSDTRIALLTGVHRKDVKRLRLALATPERDTPMVSLAASVVARWISEPRFLHADQSTRPLARTPRRGSPGEPDFATLVAEVSSDVGARAVLDELVRLGVVDVRDDGYVTLKHDGFVPREGLSESFQFLSANVSDHLATAAHNLAPDRKGPPKLEQSAFSQDLCADQVDQLHQLARKLWASALQTFLQTATVAEQRSQTHQGGKHKVRFGVYFHDTPQPNVPSARTAPPRKSRTRKNAKS